MSILRKYVRRVLEEVYQSHTFEPQPGDLVVNVNPGCVHYGSRGVVTAVDELSDGKGKTVDYKCINHGDKWSVGDVLTKTMDQLSPIE